MIKKNVKTVVKQKKDVPPIKTITAKRAIKQINNHVKDHSQININYSRWYCGVTNSSNQRQINHRYKIKSETYFWLKIYCFSKRIALAVEKHFHNLGMLDKNLTGGVNEETKYVYVYKINPTIFD